MSIARTIMIMAGGTGGHIFPALAVAEVLRKRGWNIVWLGAKAGMEATLVAPHGYTMAWINMSGVRGKGLLRALTLPLQLLIAFWQSARAILAHRPHVVLGMGGYVSFPGGMMASLLNKPLAIHEQNSIAGLSNRVLAKLADCVLAGFPDAFASGRSEWAGNPVRSEIAALTSSEVHLNIVEIRKPEIDATLIAEGIAQQLERRVAFRRAMKRAVQSAIRLGAQGIRINCSGRLGGAEIARMEWYREGRVPLHTLRANIDYAEAEAHTAYGVCGVKVWVFKGEILGHDPLATDRLMMEAQTSGVRPARDDRR